MIKNLLFDLGGVIMDIRRENCVKALEALGMTNANDMLGEYVQKGPFSLLEEGCIDAAEFRSELRGYLRPGVTDEEIDNAFLAFLVGIPLQRLRDLEALGKKYDIYLLSNTNPIMWNSKIADEFTKDGHTREYYFKGMVTSFEAKAMKPSAAIFEYAAKQLGIKPEETLFFDDSRKNIEAAEALGFKGCVVEPGKEFIDLLSDGIS